VDILGRFLGWPRLLATGVAERREVVGTTWHQTSCGCAARVASNPGHPDQSTLYEDRNDQPRHSQAIFIFAEAGRPGNGPGGG
jgi:hypothetical protein